MNFTKWFFSLFLGIFGLVLVMILVSQTAVADTNSTAGTNAPLMVEYIIPLAMTNGINGEPHNIVIQEPNHSWFTLPASNQIGELVVTSTIDYQFYVYDIPVADSEPHDLVYDGDNIWFTARAANQIGQLDVASKTIIMHNIPTTNSVPSGIAKAPDGRIWFVNNASNKLAVFNPITPGDIIEYPIVCNSSDPANLEEIAITKSPSITDSIWLTAPGCSRVFEFQPSIAAITKRIPVGTLTGDVWTPAQITIGGSNTPWITVPDEDLFAPYVPGTLAFWRWRDYHITPTPSQLSDIAFSTSDNINHVWLVEKQNNRVGLLLNKSTSNDIIFREFSLPTANSYPHSIAIDSMNGAWVTASGTNTIIEWSPPYFFSTYLPYIAR